MRAFRPFFLRFLRTSWQVCAILCKSYHKHKLMRASSVSVPERGCSTISLSWLHLVCIRCLQPSQLHRRLKGANASADERQREIRSELMPNISRVLPNPSLFSEIACLPRKQRTSLQEGHDGCMLSKIWVLARCDLAKTHMLCSASSSKPILKKSST